MTYHLDLGRVVGARQVVYLHEIHAPVGIHLETRIVILLCAGIAPVNLHVVAQPCAGRIAVGYHVACYALRSSYRQFCSHSLFRNTAHEVNAEFQPLRMHIVGKRPETDAVSGRRETVESRRIAAELVDHIHGVGLIIAARLIVLHKPADVDNDILPALVFQIQSHIVGIGLHFRFHYCRPVAVPRVPAHRRRQRPFLEGKLGTVLGRKPQRRRHGGCRNKYFGFHRSDIG